MSLLLLCVVVSAAFSAELTIESKVEKFLLSLETNRLYDFEKQADAVAPDIYPVHPGGYANIGYEVIKREKDETILTRLRYLVADDRGAAGTVAYDAMNGRYFFHSFYSPMRYTTEEVPDELSEKARKDLLRLLGSEAERFVLANTETNWVVGNTEGERTMHAYSFRFTRKINGRYIVDNSAYVRITYSGDDLLSGFEIVNPELRPVKIPMLIRQTAVRKRLETFAALKKNVGNNIDGNVTVKSITAEKGIHSYRSTNNDDKVFLAPYTSFFCRYHMKNGDTFSRFEHFSLDATGCENVEESLIDSQR